MVFVYILECGDGTLYTGWTTDIAARVAAHNKGVASHCTRSRLPVRLAYWEEAAGRSEALRREAAIKKMTRADKLKLIENSTRLPD